MSATGRSESASVSMLPEAARAQLNAALKTPDGLAIMIEALKDVAAKLLVRNSLPLEDPAPDISGLKELRGAIERAVAIVIRDDNPGAAAAFAKEFLAAQIAYSLELVGSSRQAQRMLDPVSVSDADFIEALEMRCVPSHHEQLGQV